jgi:hypothetical protein
MEDAYNRNVEAFREEEYPMLKGERLFKSLEVNANSGCRCCIPRPCGKYAVFEVTHGELHR